MIYLLVYMIVCQVVALWYVRGHYQHNITNLNNTKGEKEFVRFIFLILFLFATIVIPCVVVYYIAYYAGKLLMLGTKEAKW